MVDNDRCQLCALLSACEHDEQSKYKGRTNKRERTRSAMLGLRLTRREWTQSCCHMLAKEQ